MARLHTTDKAILKLLNHAARAHSSLISRQLNIPQPTSCNRLKRQFDNGLNKPFGGPNPEAFGCGLAASAVCEQES